MNEENLKALNQMGKGFTHPDLEEKEEEVKPYTTQELYEFMEYTTGAIISIKAILQRFKDDHYQKQETPDELDELLEEVQDSIDYMENVYVGEE